MNQKGNLPQTAIRILSILYSAMSIVIIAGWLLSPLYTEPASMPSAVLQYTTIPAFIGILATLPTISQRLAARKWLYVLIFNIGFILLVNISHQIIHLDCFDTCGNGIITATASQSAFELSMFTINLIPLLCAMTTLILKNHRY